MDTTQPVDPADTSYVTRAEVEQIVDAAITRRLTSRAPTGDLRRPLLPGMRQPGDDLIDDGQD